MHFPALLTALFIDRVLWNGPKYRNFRWMRGYLAWWLRLPFIKPARTSSWLSLIPVLPLVLVVGWLQAGLFHAAGPVLEFAFGTIVLLFSLGPGDSGREVEQYVEALGSGDIETAENLAGASMPGATTAPDALDNHMRDRLLISLCTRYIGPIVWFAVFGPAGAAAYRLAQQAGLLLDERYHVAKPNGDRLFPLLNWIPARLTAAGFAIAGNFDAVAAAWKQYSQNEEAFEQDDELLLATGQAALESSAGESQVERIEGALALGWRNLTLWVSILGLAFLLSLL